MYRLKIPYNNLFLMNVNEKLKNRRVETFFIVYPKLSAEYNLRTNKEVVFFVDTAYKGVAATNNGTVVFSS